MTKSKVTSELAKLMDSRFYTPTQAQAFLKAKVDEIFNSGSTIYTRENITLDQLEAITGSKSLRRWSEEPGFLAWLLDQTDFKKRSTALADIAINKLAEILSADADGEIIKTGDQVKAAQVAMIIADKMPQKRFVTVTLDKEINKLQGVEVDQKLLEMRERVNAMSQGVEEENVIDLAVDKE